jgi:hypothetical protein
MRNRLLLIAVTTAIAIVAVPALAYGVFATNYGVSYDAPITNSYGLTFAGQGKCIECHDTTVYKNTVHGDMWYPGLRPALPSGLTTLVAPYAVPPVAGTAPSVFSKGGSYSATALQWLSSGVFKGVQAEYMFFHPYEVPGKPASYWNSVGGLTAQLQVGKIAQLSNYYYQFNMPPNANGLSDSVNKTCYPCHFLGGQEPVADGTIIPNDHITSQGTSMTAFGWARPPGSDPTTYTSWIPGIGIACEQCHGTGVAAASSAGGHWDSGVKIVGSNSIGKANSIIDSQVCGQCHGSSVSRIAGLTGVAPQLGYTPDQRLTKWYNPYGVRALTNPSVNATAFYATIPTEAQFAAHPNWYAFFPNGDGYNIGGHSLWETWSTSAHAYRGQYTSASVDAMPFQTGLYVNGQSTLTASGHYNAKTSDLKCAGCHTGEGYLIRKDAPIAAGGMNFYPAVLSTSTVGFAGQECVTCHQGHPGVDGTTGGQEVLREPASGNASVCEDCHNWQVEQLATTPSLLSFSASHGIHPTREVYHGRNAMWETPAYPDFMPGVKCEECHAAKTNTTANRPTHNFKIMLPGDAARWSKLTYLNGSTAMPVLVGQDSCTPCHVSESRTDLQAAIDTWKADAAALSAQLTTEITAAKARAEFSTDQATAGGYLVAVGWTNQLAYTNEGSMGAHNPPYIQAGLKKGIQLAKSVGGSFVTAAPATVDANAVFAVAGTLKNGDGSGAADGTVQLFDGATKLGEVVSDTNGNFAFQLAQTSAKTYTVKWMRSSLAATVLAKGTSVGMTAARVVKIDTDLFMTCNKISDKRTYSYRLSGRIDPVMSGVPIAIYYKTPSSSVFKLYKILTTSSTGVFTMVKTTTRTTSLGTWSWRAKYAGDATHTSASAIVSVKIIR